MGGGCGWEYSNDQSMTLVNDGEFGHAWKLQGDTVRNLYLTQNSMDGLSSKFICTSEKESFS